MILAQPWLLLFLLALPLLWWLARATPPAPRSQTFPALRLLMGLQTATRSPERTPLWLLALRLAIGLALILGLADPVLNPAHGLAGSGPLLIVLDDGWASAGDWPERMAAAEGAIAGAAREGRTVALLATAPGADGAPPLLVGPLPPAGARARLQALAPLPWPTDHARAAAALRHGWALHEASVLYLADALADQPAVPAWPQALAAAGSVTERRPAAPPPLLLPPGERDGAPLLRLAAAPLPQRQSLGILVQGADGRVIDRLSLSVRAGASTAEGTLALPPGVANQITRLRLAGPATAGGTFLLDTQWQRRVVGLAAATGADAADAPLAGPLYFLNRALGAGVERRYGTLANLLARPLSVLVLSDRPLTDPAELAAVSRFVEQGGVLLRFAGPRMAATPDPLLPVHLLRQDRSLGGALSWARPEPLAAFPPTSPFAGLTAPADVTVSRQVLADPASLSTGAVWANLADGTPLVSSIARGKGRIVLFHISADADWSSLPLSGLFPAMLDRIVKLSAGQAGENAERRLAPLSIMNGYGELGEPNPAAGPITASALATAHPSPATPPGYYGTAGDRQAFNLGGAVPPPAIAPPIPGAIQQPMNAAAPERALGPPLVALATILLLADLLATLLLRGLLRRHRRRVAGLLVTLALAMPGAAQAAGNATMPPGVPQAALRTDLAYIRSGDAAEDKLSQNGLASLSDFITSRSAASLGAPAGVVPGQDDLSLYPLIYWPVTAASQPPTPAGIDALNRYMRDGGILLIDTQGGDAGALGSGSGFAPGVSDALRRVTEGLDLPPLTQLGEHHVLAHSFYLLRDFPGRYTGAPVWVASGEDAGNDGVSPVVVGANDWAAAWAMASDGTFPYAAVPGGEQQRLYAYRFGMNLVMYALTGTYKADQVHVPTLLERMGE